MSDQDEITTAINRASEFEAQDMEYAAYFQFPQKTLQIYGSSLAMISRL